MYILCIIMYHKERWKRLEVVQAMKWGMTEFEDNLNDRYGFEGEVGTVYERFIYLYAYCMHIVCILYMYYIDKYYI